MKMISSIESITFDKFRSLIHDKEKAIDTRQSLSNHKISHKIRGDLVKLLDNLCKELGLSDRTFFLTVSLFDRFMKVCKIKCVPTDIGLIGAICLMISSKFEENQIITNRFVYDILLQKEYSLKVLKKTELFILKSLKFRIALPTINDFIDLHFQKTNFLPKKFQDLSFFYSKIALQNYEFASFSPSHLAHICIEAAENEFQNFRERINNYPCSENIGDNELEAPNPERLLFNF